MDFPNPFNLAAYFLDHNLPARAERPAVYYRDLVWTYRQVHEAACRFAHAARSLGVRQEDRVLIILPDCPAFVAAIMGVHKLGAVLTMVNPRLPHEDLAYYFNYTKAPLAVIAADLAEPVARMRGGLRFLREVLVVGPDGGADSNEAAAGQRSVAAGSESGAGFQPPLPSRERDGVRVAPPQGDQSLRGTIAQVEDPLRGTTGASGTHPTTPSAFHTFNQLLAEQPAEFENAPTHPNDPAVWLFTSGTSGKPKAAVHLQHDFAYNTEHYAKQILRMSEHDRTLSVPKLFFGYATGTNLWFPFAVGGATCLFEEHATPEVMFDAIARYRPTLLTTVPTMINKMLAAPQAATADLSCLRVCVSAGEKLPAELYSRWMQRFGAEVLDGIGSAEMFHIYVSNRIGDVKVGSLGRVVPGYEAKVVDDAGAEVPPGEIGTLWIKGDSMMTGYYQDRVLSWDRLRGDWLNTCDMFRADADGYFWYEGRADDLLKVGGIFVSPGEIENCLLQHPAVAECAVIGCEDENRLVRPKAFVVVKERDGGTEGRRDKESEDVDSTGIPPVLVASDPQVGRSGATDRAALTGELIEFCKARLARYKAPSWVVYLDALPRNDRGKVERKKLA